MTTYLSDFRRARDKAEVMSYGHPRPILVVREEKFGAYLVRPAVEFDTEWLKLCARVVATFIDGELQAA